MKNGAATHLHFFPVLILYLLHKLEFQSPQTDFSSTDEQTETEDMLHGFCGLRG